MSLQPVTFKSTTLSVELVHVYDVAVAVAALLVYPASGITQHVASGWSNAPGTHAAAVLSFSAPPMIFHPDDPRLDGRLHGAPAECAQGAEAMMTTTAATICMFMFL